LKARRGGAKIKFARAVTNGTIYLTGSVSLSAKAAPMTDAEFTQIETKLGLKLPAAGGS